MGACYSKNAGDAALPSPEKLPKQKHRDSKRSKRKSTQDISPETVPLTESNPSVENKEPVNVQVQASQTQSEVRRSSTPDLVPDHLDEKIVERGVAPSDSGIESIGTPHEDVHENAQSNPEKDELSKRLERLSRGSCHKCGNFKLDDSALTALLADTYCLCGPRQAGRPSVNPQCQTHGAHRYKRSVSAGEFSKDSTGAQFYTNDPQCNSTRATTRNTDATDSGLKSSLKKPDSPKKDKSLRISGRSVDSLDLALTILSSVERSKSEFSELCFEDKTSATLAPLAEFDSVDTALNDSPLHMNEKRRSLLSEILDITDSICKCDFYSNEYCCPKDHSVSDIPTDADKSNLCTESNTVQPLNGDAHINHVNGYENFSSHNGHPDNYHEDDNQQGRNSSQRLSLLSKKSSSLPKNVSFATEKEASCEPATYSPSKCVPKSENINHSHQESTVSETSSGFYTQNSASESFLIDRSRDAHRRSASLGSGGAVLSDTSSEAPDAVTEDDLTSLDLDSLSRVTSLSYSSIRQLVESTEDLVSPLDTARRMTVDGIDCVVIPTETYRQMQSDLAMLKQQLICLSALIQEEAESMEGKQEGRMHSSFIFES